MHFLFISGVVYEKPLREGSAMEDLHVGLALGSGAARGLAHIGIIRALHDMGIQPDIVCGCSAGAVVGGAYAAGYLDTLEDWVRSLTRKSVIGFLDVSLLSGGVIAGERFINFFREQIGELHIESLPVSFASVATELVTGREVWFRRGPLVDAVRASISLPGVLAPVQINDKWLVDGGIVNPVPVSICRAMGADVVIAVNLNGGLVGRHFEEDHTKDVRIEKQHIGYLANRIKKGLKGGMEMVLSQVWRGESNRPGLFDVIAGSINIMQDRITRSRMAGDPPDLVLMPRLEHLGLLEFYRADEAIEEGKNCVRREEISIDKFLGGIT
jgi:NTE family protein